MTAQTVAGPRFWGRAGVGGTAALVGLAAALLSLLALLIILPRLSRPAAPTLLTLGQAGSPWPVPIPLIRSAELWYATAPKPGVWAELKVVLDNPLQAGPDRTTLIVSGTLMEDFRVRSTEPKLLTQPRRRPDGRYALVFPAPIPESLNWYRVYLEARRTNPRPLSLGYMLDGAKNLPDVPPTPARIFYTDRQSDPFMVVPEPLVGWVPGQARSAFPVLVLYAVAIGAVAAAGCAAAFRVVKLSAARGDAVARTGRGSAEVRVGLPGGTDR
ncbi:MAG TPA: hypothetical protein VFX49_16700 [Chloroflexota bacterium]|nr:hypothetical protein [Chloroflexota bacterium]